MHGGSAICNGGMQCRFYGTGVVVLGQCSGFCQVSVCYDTRTLNAASAATILNITKTVGMAISAMRVIFDFMVFIVSSFHLGCRSLRYT